MSKEYIYVAEVSQWGRISLYRGIVQKETSKRYVLGRSPEFVPIIGEVYYIPQYISKENSKVRPYFYDGRGTFDSISSAVAWLKEQLGTWKRKLEQQSTEIQQQLTALEEAEVPQ